MERQIVLLCAGVFNAPEWGRESSCYINKEHTRRILIGKTLVEGKTMLYIIVQYWYSFTWNTEQMFFARKAEDVGRMLRSVLYEGAYKRKAQSSF